MSACSGIAWQSDLDKKFIPRDLVPEEETNVSPRGFTMPPVDDEDLVVWMRVAATSTFTKIYRKIDQFGLRKGDVLELEVSPRFDVRGFKGEKAIVVSTMSWLGGKNDALGIVNIVVGVICLLLAALFFVLTRNLDHPKQSLPLN